MFSLHEQLKADTYLLGEFPLSLLLLARDANYPWFILVPRVEGISEIYQLQDADRLQLLRESSRLAAHLQTCFRAEKLNIAALGNVVPQLHVHHIVRYRNDPAWPSPVWGVLPATPYTDGGLASVISRLDCDGLAEFKPADAIESRQQTGR